MEEKFLVLIVSETGARDGREFPDKGMN